ncbi:type III effector protein [Ralstonia solanacearum]|uniref:type III effector protein n=1 Tax=Ralstonia solanacearum TaxID=305 RepID=UPI00168B6451|nr:type III effector protein [Ralstonia solanacearum]AYB54305.2 type III effector protein [Ralstonia solanacearum]AYB58861.2 type III effector protein [Ralstonia solanacearum]
MGNLQIKPSPATYIPLPDSPPESTGSQPPTPKLTRVASPTGALADLPTKGAGKLPQVSAQSASPKAIAGTSQPVQDKLPLSFPEPPHLASASKSSAPAKSAEKLGAVTVSGRFQLKNGELTSNNETIRNLIRYLGDDAKLFANRTDLDGMEVKIRPHPDAAAALKALKKHCNVKQVLVHADAPSRSQPAKNAQQERLLAAPAASQLQEEKLGKTSTLTPLLLSVIAHGHGGLGSNDQVRDLSGKHVPVHDFLAALAPQVSVNDPELALVFNSKLHADTEASAKLGAATLLQMATNKTFALKELAMSLAISSGLGALWELGGAELIKNALKTLNLSPTRYILSAAGVDSVPSAIIEIADSAIVLSAVKAMNQAAASFLQRLRESLPAATVAGIKSAVGSYANNVMQYMSTGSSRVDLALNTATTEVAILAAASGIPGEIKDNEANLKAAILEQMRKGLMEPPHREPHMSPEQYTAQLKKHVEKVAQQALDMSPGNGIAQKSLAFASMVGLIPLLLSDKVTNLVPESTLRIMRSTMFNPIESIGMNVLVLTSKINIPGLMNSDAQKHKQVMNRILQEATLGKPLQDGEVHQLFHQWDGLNRAGRVVLEGMSLTMDALPNKLTRMVKGEPAPLSQRIAYESIDYDRV